MDEKLAALRLNGPATSVHESPNSIDSLQKGNIKVEPIESFCVRQTHSFTIHAPGYSKDELQVAITGAPTGIQMRLMELQSGTFRVYFSVRLVGTYVFQVFYVLQKHLMQTFTGKAYDVSKILLTNVPSSCILNEKCEFRVDASQAGEGQLEIAVNEGEVANQVSVLGNGRCAVSFKPITTTDHVVDIKFNGESVPSCPFSLPVLDSKQFTVHLTGGELLPVGQQAQINISSSSNAFIGASNQLEVHITAPSGKPVAADLRWPGDTAGTSECNTLCVKFVPTEIGAHVVHVHHLGKPLASSPFVLKTFDATQVHVQPARQGALGKPVEFIVDASHAGEGNLEIAVHSHSRNVLTQVYSLGGAKFRVEFVPEKSDPHVVNVHFNGAAVLNSPFSVQICGDVNKVSASGGALHFAPVEQMSTIRLHNAPDLRQLQVRIEAPGGSLVRPEKVYTDEDEKCTLVDFAPNVTGEHCIHLSYEGVPVAGSPFTTKVYDLKQIKVKEMPSEIRVGKPITFLVEAANAGPGNLEVIVNNGKVPSTPEALGPALYAITFVPKQVQQHLIHIKFNGELVHGAPFRLHVLDASLVQLVSSPVERQCVGTKVSFRLASIGIPLNKQMIQALSPSQKALLVKLVPLVDSSVDTSNANDSLIYEASFIPDEVGDHLVDIRVAEESVGGSPFCVKVYDASKVKLDELTDGQLNRPVYFSIDASQAGAGNLEIIVSVNGRNVPNYVQSEGNAKFRVNFKPTEASAHAISVKFNGQPVPGSPFRVQVHKQLSEQINATNLIMDLSSQRVASILKGIVFHVRKDVQRLQTLPEVLIQTPANRKVPAQIQETLEDIYKCTYQPNEVGPHQVFVYLDKQLADCCPFMCNVYDVSKVKLSGLELACLGRPITFQVDASQAGEGTLELVVTTRKCSVRAEVLMRSRGLYDVTFVAQQQTQHFVNVTFNEKDVPGSPFKVDIAAAPLEGFGTPLTTISEMGERSLNQIDKQQPLLAPSKGDFSALQLNARIKGNPCGLVGANTTVRLEISEEKAGTLSTLGEVDYRNSLEAILLGPGDWPIACKVTPLLGANELQVEFIAKEVGCYRLNFKTKNIQSHLLSQPLYIECVDPSRVRLLNVKDGLVKRIETFLIDCSKAGAGDLQVRITCKQQPVPFELLEQRGKEEWNKVNSPTQVIRAQSGIFQVQYRPEIDLPHYIDVHYNGHQAAGCPQMVEIRDPLELITLDERSVARIKFMQVNVQQELLIHANGLNANSSEFSCNMFDCANQQISSKIEEHESGEEKEFRMHFMPTTVGTCRIEINYLGQPLSGAPLICECFDISKVLLEPITSQVTSETICLALDRKNAGYAELDVVVTSPLGRHLPIELKTQGSKELICFVPTVEGKYKVAINYGGLPVPGTPILFHAKTGIGKSEISKEESFLQKAPTVNFKNTSAIVGEPFLFTVDANGAKGLPQINIDGPCGEADVVVEETKRIFLVSFIPACIGIFEVRILWSGIELAKEPHKVYAVNLSQVRPKHGWPSVLNANKLFALQLGQTKKITFVTNDAGPGKLRAELLLPNGKCQQNLLEQTGNHKYKFSYTPKQAGNYTLNLFYGDLLLPQCPLVASTSGDTNSKNGKYAEESQNNEVFVTLRGQGLAGCAVGQQGQFIVDGSAAGPGEPQLQLKPIDIESSEQRNVPVTVQIEPIQSKVFRVTYCAQLAGIYSLNVLWAGRQVAGCPLKLQITSRPDNANGIVVQVPKEIHAGKRCSITIEMSKAIGPLQAHLQGPSGQVQCSLSGETQKGIQILSFMPSIAGKYILSVKYAGEPVNGSPFTFNVNTAPDASKVKVFGPGVEHGVLPLYQSRFVCDTKGAGAGQLTVRIRGPKGAFRVEMARENLKERSILCKYDPTEPGHYRIEVKWSNEHVPHSPFDVLIFDTQAELNRYLHNGIMADRINPMAHFATEHMAAPAQLQHPHIGPLPHSIPIGPIGAHPLFMQQHLPINGAPQLGMQSQFLPNDYLHYAPISWRGSTQEL